MIKEKIKLKSKPSKIITIFVVLLVVMCYACREELSDLVPDLPGKERENLALIEQAKAWYEINKPKEVALRSSNEESVVLMKPDWRYAGVAENKENNVVETEIMSKGRLSYMNADCMEKYRETKDPKYKQSHTRMVFRSSKKTGETTGFFMTIVPNLEWLEKSNFKPHRNVGYVHRNKDFGGMILFHELDGSFSNGWKYENGEITGEIKSLDDEQDAVSLRSNGGCNEDPIYETVEICQDIWQTIEIVGVGKTEPVKIGEICRDVQVFVGYTQNCPPIDDPDGEYGWGGSTGGGDNSSTPTNRQPERRNDCGDGGADRRSNNAKIITSQVSSSYNSFMGYTSSGNEYSARIDWNGSNYQMTTPVQGGTNSASASAAMNTMYSMHTHTLDSEPPSPKDFKAILDINSYYYPQYGGTGYNLQGAIVINNNTEYLISIVDKEKAYNFSNSNNANIFQDASTSGKTVFENSYIDSEFNAISENLYNQGYTDEQSNYTYTMSYLLDRYNTGLTISTKKRTENSFREVKTNYINNSYKPTICP